MLKKKKIYLLAVPEQYYSHGRRLNLLSNGKRVGLMQCICLCTELHNQVDGLCPSLDHGLLSCLWSTVISLLEVTPTKNISQDCCLFDYEVK